MINNSEKYHSMLNGGRDSFTIKEILVEFMKSQKEFNEHITDMTSEIKVNSTAIKYIKIGIGLIFTVLGYLVLV